MSKDKDLEAVTSTNQRLIEIAAESWRTFVNNAPNHGSKENQERALRAGQTFSLATIARHLSESRRP